MTTTFTVEADFDNDGTFEADLTQYVENTAISRGFSSERARVADTGRITFTLNNADGRFSPLNSGGPYFGTLLPYRAIRIRAHSGASSWTRFRGYIRGFAPEAGVNGNKLARVWAEDAFNILQRDNIAMPLQEDKTADDLITKICTQIFGGDASSGTVFFNAEVSNDEEVQVGDRTYTFKDTLTGAANEVATNSGRYAATASYETAVDLAAAINADIGAGTYYGAGTTRHEQVTALGYLAIGTPDSERDTSVTIGDVTTGYTRLASAFAFGGGFVDEPTELPFYRIYIPLWKVGSPSGRTVTVSIESPTGAGGVPSGTLGYVGAQTTFDADTLSASVGDYVAIDFTPGTLSQWSVFEESQLWWVTVAIDGAASDVNHLVWGADADGLYGSRCRESHYTGGAWSSPVLTNTPIVWVPGRVELTANLRGAWANAIVLDAAAFHADADSLTINDGAIVSGTLANTNEANDIFLVLSEVTGTPGFDYEFPFTVSGDGLLFTLKGFYDGNPAHNVNIDVYNGSTWDTLGTLPSSLINAVYQFTLDSEHTVGGVVTIRIQHTSSGDPGHELHIDHLVVQHSEPSGATAIQPSGATLSGGTDAPAGLLDIQEGRQTFDIAADLWNDEDTTGKDAGADVTYSEYGLWWIAGDGTITFRNRDFEFGLPQVTPALTVSGTHDRQQGVLSDDRVRNHIIINYAPRGEKDEGTVARSNRTIKVEGTSGKQRWSKEQGYIGSSNADAPQPGDTVIRLPFRDIDGGRASGAKNVITPVPGTDYSVNDAADGTGFNYTLSGRITMAMVVQGSAVELSIGNDATGPLYVSDLVVRGTLLISWDVQQEIFEDTTSIAAYGKRVWRYDVPLPSDGVFLESLASYLCGRFKTPAYVVDAITFEGQMLIGGVNLMSLDIGDVVALAEDQTGVSAALYYIRGFDTSISGDGQDTTITLRLKPISNQTYWILDNATYGVLDSTTRLAL